MIITLLYRYVLASLLACEGGYLASTGNPVLGFSCLMAALIYWVYFYKGVGE